MNVSIIIPVYNAALYIEDCLRSVMRQTYTGSMECLIIDDCGSDDSIAIAERLMADYTGPIQFRILHHEHNRGLSAARNTGTLAATGDYLYYLDSDDEITEDCIKKLMQKMMENSDVEMVAGNGYRHLTPQKSVVFWKKPILAAVTNDEVRKCYFQHRQMGAVWNKLLRRDFIIKNNILCKEGVIWEDMLWTFILLKQLNKACFLPDVTYHYKLRANSIVTGTDNRTGIHNLCIIYRYIFTHLTPGHEREEFNHYAKRICGPYIRSVREEPTIRDVFLLCREKSVIYGNRSVRLRLAICSVLGQAKYGYIVWKLMKWLRYPLMLFFRMCANSVRSGLPV